MLSCLLWTTLFEYWVLMRRLISVSTKDLLAAIFASKVGFSAGPKRYSPSGRKQLWTQDVTDELVCQHRRLIARTHRAASLLQDQLWQQSQPVLYLVSTYQFFRARKFYRCNDLKLNAWGMSSSTAFAGACINQCVFKTDNPYQGWSIAASLALTCASDLPKTYASVLLELVPLFTFWLSGVLFMFFSTNFVHWGL